MMVLPEVKLCSRGKLLSHLDLRVRTDTRKTTSKDINFRIGSWNVRTLGQVGILENLTAEMDKSELSVGGLSEVRWPGKGKIVSGNVVFYSGGVTAEKGFAGALRNNIVKRVPKVECYSDKLMFVKISAKTVDFAIVQVYIPTTDHDGDELEKM